MRPNDLPTSAEQDKKRKANESEKGNDRNERECGRDAAGTKCGRQKQATVVVNRQAYSLIAGCGCAVVVRVENRDGGCGRR